MNDLHELAVEAVKARYDKSPLYNDFLRELEAAGCSHMKIKTLLARAESVVPNPHVPRALRILRRAAKVAARGEAERVERLCSIACDLVGGDEVTALAEEYRLSFVVQKPPAEPKRLVRAGFAA